MRYLIIAISVLLLFSQCEKFPMDRKYSLFLKNNSGDSLFCYIALGVGKGANAPLYPDTLLEKIVIDYDYGVIGVEENAILHESSVKWKSYFQELPQDTLSIYLFSLDTLKSNTWEDVQAGYKILKRYDLSLEDLEYLDYKLSYPPDAKMSGVKMYPTYP